MFDLQRAMIICERWALKCGMRWALSKGKSEVLLPSEIALQYKAFPFAGGQITTVTQARYLGVVLSANGILGCSLKNRIQMSHASLSKLRNGKLIFPGFDPRYAKMVYRTLLERKIYYATFLCPSSADALHAFDCLLQRFFHCCLGIRVRQSQIRRLLLMFNIDTLRIRRRTLASAFVGGLMSIPDDDHAIQRQKIQAEKTQIAFNSSEAFQLIVPLVAKPLRKDQIISMEQTMRERISNNMRRPVPISTRLPPALQLKYMKHRAVACRWHLGVFSVHYRYLSSVVLHMYLDDMSSLSQKKVLNLELKKVRIALTVLSSIPKLDCFSALE